MNLKFYFLAFCIVLSFNLSAQSLSGQWTGGFVSTGDPWGRQTEYVLELEVSGTVAKGYSYTYFIIMGKRHYVICRLSGTYDKGSKSVTVSEVEKVKSNTPPDFKDCFQTHSLTFLKQGDKEVLEGRWKPATTKDNCGTGETQLERKALVKLAPAKTGSSDTQGKTTPPQLGVAKTTPQKTTTTAPKTAPPPVKKPATTTVPPKTNTITRQPATGTQKPKPSVPSNGTREVTSNTKPAQKPAEVEKTQSKIANPQSPTVISSTNTSKLETRSKQVIKEIEVPESYFKIDLYDNGQVDGDTISVFFNGKMIVSSKRLSTNPITVNVKLDTNRSENELVMYAENLGSIPPNTALMVVTVGDKRYEVNITSTEQTNGTVRFKLKE